MDEYFGFLTDWPTEEIVGTRYFTDEHYIEPDRFGMCGNALYCHFEINYATCGAGYGGWDNGSGDLYASDLDVSLETIRRYMRK